MAERQTAQGHDPGGVAGRQSGHRRWQGGAGFHRFMGGGFDTRPSCICG
jgi:hypothetical protein